MGSKVAFVFDDLSAADPSIAQDEWMAEREIGARWGSFIRAGNPSLASQEGSQQSDWLAEV